MSQTAVVVEQQQVDMDVENSGANQFNKNLQAEPRERLSSVQMRLKRVKELMKQPAQLFFVIQALVALVGIGPFTYYCYKYTAKAIENKPAGYVFPDWKDFKWTLASVVVISVCDVISHKVFYRLFLPICKEQDNEKERARRTEKMAYSFFKLIYFLAVSVWGFAVLFDKHFFPAMLGGSGDFYNCSVGYPYQKAETRSGIFLFLVLQLGFHVQTLIRMYSPFQQKTRDIFEMTLHEVLAIYLYSGCFLTNFWEIGAVVSLLHQVSDILIMACKVLSETKYSFATAILFLLEMIIWFYTRLIVFPWIAWVATTQDIDMGSWLILPFFGYGLFCLVFMHAYWFHLFVQILLYYSKKGEADDKIEKDLNKSNSENKGSDEKPLETRVSDQIDTNRPVLQSLPGEGLFEDPTMPPQELDDNNIELKIADLVKNRQQQKSHGIVGLSMDQTELQNQKKMTTVSVEAAAHFEQKSGMESH